MKIIITAIDISMSPMSIKSMTISTSPTRMKNLTYLSLVISSLGQLHPYTSLVGEAKESADGLPNSKSSLTST